MLKMVILYYHIVDPGLPRVSGAFSILERENKNK